MTYTLFTAFTVMADIGVKMILDRQNGVSHAVWY